MTDTIASLLPVLALVSHIVFVALFVSFVFRKSWGKKTVLFMGQHSLVLGFLVSLAAVAGSLFYSEIMGFEPCVLCWWQRVLLYPTIFIFAVALWRRERSAYYYVVPPVVLASIIAVYQSYVFLGGSSFLTCTNAEGACSKIYVVAFGYITIPIMSLTISLYILFLAWANKIYKDENNNA
ncbi:MAG: disulfide bond formation protein B [bacterium]|nr:disulfide bond formation protein B [bacterium]MDZ4205925.1 disulfide bond formation protein B [Patescibacteria group bacterium]